MPISKPPSNIAGSSNKFGKGPLAQVRNLCNESSQIRYILSFLGIQSSRSVPRTSLLIFPTTSRSVPSRPAKDQTGRTTQEGSTSCDVSQTTVCGFLFLGTRWQLFVFDRAEEFPCEQPKRMEIWICRPSSAITRCLVLEVLHAARPNGTGMYQLEGFRPEDSRPNLTSTSELVRGGMC